MKKAFLFLGFVAVAAAVGGATAWAVSEHREQPVQYIERTVSHNSTPQAGNHFTSYQADQYPDLTYAAENAVKAVVNIESIQQIEMPRRRSYDPFLEFFGSSLNNRENKGDIVFPGIKDPLQVFWLRRKDSGRRFVESDRTGCFPEWRLLPDGNPR